MTQVFLASVEEFAGSNDKGPWVKYTLKDQNGEAFAATFSTELGVVAKNLEGKHVAVTTKAASNPKYAPTLVSIEAATDNGSPTPAQSNPTPPARVYSPDLKDRMIVRQTALKAAAEIVGPRAGSTLDPDYDAALETMKAAQRFETWVYRDIDPVPSEAGRPALSEHDAAIPY